MAEGSGVDILGAWSRYFNNLSQLLEGAERQYGVADMNFCEYVLERLELCIDVLENLHDHMMVSLETESDDIEVIEQYRSDLQGLVRCLRRVHMKWLEYEDVIGIRVNRFRYQVESMRLEGRGRPKFKIDREQLVYLSSLNFSWTEIAHLMGVSRMTIYRLVCIFLLILS